MLSLVAKVILAGLLLRFVCKAFYNLTLHPLKKVPGPFLAKIFPQYMIPSGLRLQRAQKLLELHKQYGCAVRVAPDEVSISDYALYREIYSSKTSSKDEGFYGSASLLGHYNLFSMRDKTQHAARRRMQSHPYSHQAISENEALILEIAERFVQRILDAARQSKSIANTANVWPLCGLFATEVVCKLGFNKDISESSMEDGLEFFHALDDSAAMLPLNKSLPFFQKYGIGPLMPGFIGHTFKQFAHWEKLTRDLFQHFRAESEKDPTERFLATHLLSKEDVFLGRKLTETEALSEAMGTAFAGSGTTSSTLVYLLYNLALPENRHVQIKLREEVQAAGSKLQDVKDLPYLNAVIHETMRLNPTIISTLPRTLDMPLSIPKADLVLPAGTQVGMQNYVHHRDPTVYADPESFRPERWLDRSPSSSMDKALTPFSLGPRNCIGQNLARAELWLVVSAIFRKLDLTYSAAMGAGDMNMQDTFTISPRGKKLLLEVQPCSA